MTLLLLDIAAVMWYVMVLAMIIILVVFVLTFEVEFASTFNIFSHAVIILRWVLTFVALPIWIWRIVTVVISKDICFYDARLSHFFAQVVLLAFQVVDDAFVVLGDLNIWLILVFLYLF